MDIPYSGFRVDGFRDAGAPSVYDFDASDLGCASGLAGEIRRGLAAIVVGERLRVSTREPSAREDLPALARLLGHRVIAVDRTGETTIILMERTQ